ncbi:MAG: hypothetical protein Q8N59_01685 [bacterium]|nr:hypothetical protein [bacterium]
MSDGIKFIEELERMDCETMTIQYEEHGAPKEFPGPKKEVIALYKKILRNPKTMKFIGIDHPRKTAT